MDSINTLNNAEKAPPASAEVRPKRRRFSQVEKTRILAELDACQHGERGLVLRREGIYSSTAAVWRKEQTTRLANGGQSLREKARQDKALQDELAQVKRKLLQAEERMAQMEIIIDVQKKVSQILGVRLPHVGT